MSLSPVIGLSTESPRITIFPLGNTRNCAKFAPIHDVANSNVKINFFIKFTFLVLEQDKKYYTEIHRENTEIHRENF
jgi:hypothetical protein